MRGTTITFAALAAAMLVGGCDGGTEPTATLAPPVAGGTSPVTNWKSEQLKKAMAGLDYSGGRVKPAQDAAKISGPGTPAEVAAQLKEADRWLNVENEPFATIAAYTKAVIMDPRNVEALYGLALALRTKGKSDEMEAALNTALAVDPRHVDSLMLLGYTLAGRQKDAEAMAAFERALAVQPTNLDGHVRVAILAYYAHDYAKAWKHVHRAEALGGEVPPQFRPLLAQAMKEPKRA